MFCTQYRGETDISNGILTVRRPSIPAPEERIEEVEIPGRNGALIMSGRSYAPITIPVEFNFLNKEDNWQDIFRKAKSWLSGSGDLVFSDDADHFYKCYYVVISDVERTTRRLGKFTAEFHCDPFCYLLSGEKEVGLNDDGIFNPGILSAPLYRIEGSGSCTLSINNVDVEITVDGEIYIDTERQICYENDKTYKNTSMTGQYEALFLQPEGNTVSVSSGFDVFVTPRWREL